MNHWLVIYDIRDDKRLHRIAKFMEGYGVRVQKSVFEVIANEKTIDRIRKNVKRTINVEEDYVVFFNLCEQDWQKREKYGPGKYQEEDTKPYRIL